MRVRGDLAPQAVRIGHDRLQFRLRKLRVLRIIAQREHAAGGANLDDVGAVLDDLAHLVLHVLDSISDTDFGGVPLVGQQVVIAVSAGDAQRRTAGVDAWARNIAGIDGVAQGDVGKLRRAQIATVVKPASKVTRAFFAPISASRGNEMASQS